MTLKTAVWIFTIAVLVGFHVWWYCDRECQIVDARLEGIKQGKRLMGGDELTLNFDSLADVITATTTTGVKEVIINNKNLR